MSTSAACSMSVRDTWTIRFMANPRAWKGEGGLAGNRHTLPLAKRMPPTAGQKAAPLAGCSRVAGPRPRQDVTRPRQTDGLMTPSAGRRGRDAGVRFSPPRIRVSRRLPLTQGQLYVYDSPRTFVLEEEPPADDRTAAAVERRAG